jgi:hypothetical protein
MLREISSCRILELSGSKSCKDRELDRHILLQEFGVGAPFLEAVETDTAFYQGSFHIIIVLELATGWVRCGSLMQIKGITHIFLIGIMPHDLTM